MFPTSYFPVNTFAPHYFPRGLDVATVAITDRYTPIENITDQYTPAEDITDKYVPVVNITSRYGG